MAFEFFKRWFGARDAPREVTAAEFFELCADSSIREMAFQSCVNLIANAVSKCELKTYQNHEAVQDREHYLWNVSPNQNQNSTAFWHKLVYRLCRDRAALVFENAGMLYVADSFDRKEYALYDDVFTGVTVGTFTFNQSFVSSEVMFFELAPECARRVTERLYDSYAKLIAYGMKSYQRSRGEKGVLELDASVAGGGEFQETYTELKNEGFRKFVEADAAVMPLWKGMKYTSIGDKTYSGDSTRDIRAMIDDVTDFTARAFGIPPALLNGSVEDVREAVNQFLTFCIDPLTDNLAEEINRKRYGFQLVSRGNYVEFDTNRIKHVDMLDAAGSIDKLIGSGVECVNDMRALLGQPLIPEAWAFQHFITKNYAAMAEGANAQGEGDSSEDQL